MVALFWMGLKHCFATVRHCRQEHVLCLHSLICVLLDKAQQEIIGESKSEVQVVSKQGMPMWDCEKYQSRMIQSHWVLFFPPLPCNEVSAGERPDSAERFTSNASHFVLVENHSTRALSSQIYSFPSACFLVMQTAPKLWERHQNSCGYFKVWQSR